MASEYGEIRYDREDLPQDVAHLVTSLESFEVVSFTYAAHGTAWHMVALAAKALAPGGGTWPMLFGTSPGGIDAQRNSHTLWLRERDNNHHAGPWLANGGLHVPEYLAEKFDVNGVDAHAIAVLLELVEGIRRADGSDESIAHEAARCRENIALWTERLEQKVPGAGRELPAFMDKQPDQPEEDTT